MDRDWWKIYRSEVLKDFTGEPWTVIGGINGVHRVLGPKIGSKRLRGWVGNSGAGAILLASHCGAERIVLLGYDCHRRGGAHHHGNHPKGLGNAGSLHKWPEQFAQVARMVAAEVINCSPGTALNVFPRGEMCDVLHP